MIAGFKVRRHLGGDLSCQHPLHDPSFPFWVCPTCGSQVFDEAILLQKDFDARAFQDALSRDSLGRYQSDTKDERSNG